MSNVAELLHNLILENNRLIKDYKKQLKQMRHYLFKKKKYIPASFFYAILIS